MSFRDCFKMEYRISQGCMVGVWSTTYRAWSMTYGAWSSKGSGGYVWRMSKYDV